MGDSMPGAESGDDRAGSGSRHQASHTLQRRSTGAPGPQSTGASERSRTAAQLRRQADSCAEMGSPLYATLLTHAADDCETGGPVWRVLRPHAAPGRGNALALRLMAAVHRLVLQRRAPLLSTFYPSVGGTGRREDAWPAFRSLLADHGDAVSQLVASPCQTNEVGRSAGLLVGLFDVARRTHLPVRLLEVGASAGLNLRCDHFRVGGAGVVAGDADSPVDLSSHWSVPPPWTPPRLNVVARRGCDAAPVDPATPEGRLTLTASVWADQRDRHERLRGALALAERIPAAVDQASLDAWTAAQLADLPDAVATVVTHSVVLEYLAAETRAAFEACVAEAASRATAQSPLAWVRLEPVSRLRHHAIDVTLWPGGQTRRLARCGAHGTDVEWLASS